MQYKSIKRNQFVTILKTSSEKKTLLDPRYQMDLINVPWNWGVV